MLEPRMVAARIQGAAACRHGESAGVERIAVSSQGAFIEVRDAVESSVGAEKIGL